MPDHQTKQGGNEKPKSESYRLVIFRSEDFQEIRSFNLTLSNIYVLFSAIILILGITLYSLIAFTPLKKLIPGYAQIEATQEFLQLVDGVNELSAQIESQEVYLGALKNLLGTGITDLAATETSSLMDRNVIAGGEMLSSQPSTDPQAADYSEITYYSTDHWISLTQDKLFNPVEGIISSEFNPVIKHFGVDILAPAQSPIISIKDGFVFSSGWDLETGYTIGIQHEGNFLSFYKHNSQLLKEKGTFVRAGEAVAIIGNTGTLSNGPHLHFEIWHNGKPINPKDVINFN